LSTEDNGLFLMKSVKTTYQNVNNEDLMVDDLEEIDETP